MSLENRWYYPEELSPKGHTISVTKDFWNDNDYSKCINVLSGKTYREKVLNRFYKGRRTLNNFCSFIMPKIKEVE